MRTLAEAVRFLTIVPVPSRPGGEPPPLGATVGWFPVVGLAIGLMVAGVDRLAALLFPPLLVALLSVTAWKLVTGGLHLDGLADCLDGLVGRDVDHRLEIMRDSRIGAFGAIGLILFVLLELGAIVELPASIRWRVLAAAPAIGRAVPPLVGCLFSPARRDGYGARFHATLSGRSVAVAVGLAGVTAVAALGWAGLIVTVVAVVVGVGFSRVMAGRLGGVTGDVLGASVEAGELGVLLAMSAWPSVRP